MSKQTWFAMPLDRNGIIHAYYAVELQRLVARILDRYILCFGAMVAAIKKRYGNELEWIA